MSERVVVLVPRRPDPWRDQLWEWARPRWAELAPVVEGVHDDDGPFNRSAAVNAAAAEAGPWDVAVVVDADVVLANPEQLHQAVAHAAATGGPALAYTTRVHCGRQMTGRMLRGYTGNWAVGAQLREDSCSSANVLRRDLWDQLGGYDERFVGWGWEDRAFQLATEAMAGQATLRVPGTLWHLWHPRSSTARGRHPLTQANRDRCAAYIAAEGNPVAMAEVLAR